MGRRPTDSLQKERIIVKVVLNEYNFALPSHACSLHHYIQRTLSHQDLALKKPLKYIRAHILVHIQECYPSCIVNPVEELRTLRHRAPSPPPTASRATPNNTLRTRHAHDKLWCALVLHIEYVDDEEKIGVPVQIGIAEFDGQGQGRRMRCIEDEERGRVG